MLVAMNCSSRRGASLVMVLLVLSLSLVVVFSLASFSIIQLRTSTGTEESDHARNLAESAIYMGIDKLCTQANYGLAKEHLDAPAADYPRISQGVLTFDPDQASALKMGTSFNNLGSKQNGISPDGRTVPGETALLVGMGKSGNARIEVECMYYRPSFPTGLHTGGTLTATGLQMAGLMPGVEFLGNLGSHPPQDLRPVDLHSNASLNLGAGSEVSGDVSAVDQITLTNDAKVRGEVRPFVAPQLLPSLNLAQIRQSLIDDGIAPIPVGGSVGSISVNWYSESTTDLVINGDLNLDGGLLYVHGNVDVTGKVTGRGALVSRRNITIHQGSNLDMRTVTVLAADGDITLEGQAASKYFHGLCYSGGSLTASDMTVVGSLVCHGSTQLDNVDLVQTEVATSQVLGRPVRSSNNEDVFFWYVNRGEPDPVTREPRYDYYIGIYIYAFTSVYDGAPDFQLAGKNKTRAQVEAEMLPFADVDYQAVDDVATGPVTPGSQFLAGPLSNYLNNLNTAGPTTLNFDLNRLLTPTQTSRIMLWQRRH